MTDELTLKISYNGWGTKMKNKESLKDSCIRLIYYLWESELNDYTEQRDTGDLEPNCQSHIFTHIARIDSELSGLSKTAEDYYTGKDN